MIRVKNGSIVKKGNELKKVTIYVENGKIKAIFPGNDKTFPCKEEIDAEDNVIFPGFIDPHVHFDDPGFTEREDFETGTRSAAAGGVTTIIDMPCTSVPPVITGKNFDNKLRIVQPKAYVDFAFWGGVTPEQIENDVYKKTLRELKNRGIVGVKFYTLSGMPLYPRMPVSNMDKAFRELKKMNLVCAVHAEDFYLVDFYTHYLQETGRIDYKSWFEGRVYEAEPEAIWAVVGITEKVGNKLHIVHLSTKEGLDIIRWAKMHNLDITAETCPQYLLFTVDNLVKIGPVLKTAPPVRREEDRSALWKGLQDGTIDFISTDHAAGKYPEEKSPGNIWKAYAGIPGTQLVVPIMFTYGYHSGKLLLDEMQRLMSENTAKRYGLYPQKGSIKIGTDADLTIINLKKEWVVDPTKLESKGKYSAVAGRKLKGKVVKTVVRGRVIFDERKGITGNRGYGKLVKSQL